MNKTAMAVTILISLAIAVLRFIVPVHGVDQQDIFKDAAHLWVGGVIGAAIASRKGWLACVAGALTAAELAAAFLR